MIYNLTTMFDGKPDIVIEKNNGDVVLGWIEPGKSLQSAPLLGHTDIVDADTVKDWMGDDNNINSEPMWRFCLVKELDYSQDGTSVSKATLMLYPNGDKTGYRTSLDEVMSDDYYGIEWTFAN